MDADKANGFANSLNKKQKVFDKMIEKWKRKCGVLLTREIEANKRKTRNGATEIFRFAGSKKADRSTAPRE
ncbi:Myosin heavy chain, muscle [Dirofilaria immitis]